MRLFVVKVIFYEYVHYYSEYKLTLYFWSEATSPRPRFSLWLNNPPSFNVHQRVCVLKRLLLVLRKWNVFRFIWKRNFIVDVLQCSQWQIGSAAVQCLEDALRIKNKIETIVQALESRYPVVALRQELTFKRSSILHCTEINKFTHFEALYYLVISSAGLGKKKKEIKINERSWREGKWEMIRVRDSLINSGTYPTKSPPV